MLKKLESLKQIGMYAVTLYFGCQSVGGDDGDIPTADRDLTVLAAPVGSLGETRVMFKGTVREFMDFNFSTKPLMLSNPPKEEEYKAGGWFLWGTERMVEDIQKRIASSALSST